MIYNMNTEITIDGEYVNYSEDEKRHATFFDVIKRSLLSDIVLDSNNLIKKDGFLSGEDKYKRYELVNKIKNNPCKLCTEEVAFIKNLSGAFLNTNFVGVVWDFLENDFLENDIKEEEVK